MRHEFRAQIRNETTNKTLAVDSSFANHNARRSHSSLRLDAVEITPRKQSRIFIFTVLALLISENSHQLDRFKKCLATGLQATQRGCKISKCNNFISPSSCVGTLTVTTSPRPTLRTDSGSRLICSLNSSI